MDPVPPGRIAELFPAECHVKIIAQARPGVAAELDGVLERRQRAERVREGHRSAGGRYVTYNVSLVLETVEEMRELDAAFRAVDGVRMVL